MTFTAYMFLSLSLSLYNTKAYIENYSTCDITLFALAFIISPRHTWQCILHVLN